MAIQHTVQAGDTVSAIAKRFNVPTSAVSGFRSNDPNVIFPGEILNIQNQSIDPGFALPSTNNVNDPGFATQTSENVNDPGFTAIPQQGQVVDGSALQANVVAPTQDIQTPVESTDNIAPGEAPQDAGAGAITETIKQTGEQAKIATGAISEQPVVELPTAEESLLAEGGETTFEDAIADAETFFTPSGAEVTEEGEIVSTPESEVDRTLGQFGISGEEVGQGFQTNPFGTLSEIVKQVMQMTGLPDVREQVTSTANEIEELELERDRQIANIQDDPFSSVGSKRQMTLNISDAFDKRINARVNKLTLLQSAQQDARQQAQFAATTAINLFGKQQEFQADQVEDILDREEKKAEAEARLAPLTTETVDGFTVLRDSTGKVISTVKPSERVDVSAKTVENASAKELKTITKDTFNQVFANKVIAEFNDEQWKLREFVRDFQKVQGELRQSVEPEEFLREWKAEIEFEDKATTTTEGLSDEEFLAELKRKDNE